MAGMKRNNWRIIAVLLLVAAALSVDFIAPNRNNTTESVEYKSKKTNDDAYRNHTSLEVVPTNVSLTPQTSARGMATSIARARLNECYLRANALIQRETLYLRQHRMPLYSSIIRMPLIVPRGKKKPDDANHYWAAYFSLWEATKRFSKERKDDPQWTEAIWHCDDRRAKVVLKGLERAEEVLKGFTVQCPQTGPNAQVSNITVTFQVNATTELQGTHTYFVGQHVDCERRHKLSPPSTNRKVATMTLLYQMPLRHVLEWVEYHRIIGVDHFFLYVMDKDLDGWWPNLPYITYVPWNLNPTMEDVWDIFSFQMSAQMDAIHRGRVIGLEWMAFNDMDEFLVVRGNQTLKGYLDGLVGDESGVQLETVTFGRPNHIGKDLSVGEKPLLSYTWRSIHSYGKKRSKAILRPSRVEYYKVHWIINATATGPIHWAPSSEFWIHHYKNARDGIFHTGLPSKEQMEDAVVRDKYLVAVESQVEAILLCAHGGVETFVQNSWYTNGAHHEFYSEGESFVPGLGMTQYRYHPKTFSIKNIAPTPSAVVVGVLSSALAAQDRARVRDTWADGHSNVFFLVSGNWTAELASEFETHKDLLWIDQPESYRGITVKTVVWFSAVHQHIPHALVVKTDDDSYVRMTAMQDIAMNTSSLLYRGGGCRAMSPAFHEDPSDPWYVPEDLYAGKYYPPYALGGGYILGNKTTACLVQQIQREVNATHIFPIEDAYVGILLERSCPEVKCQKDFRILANSRHPIPDHPPCMIETRSIMHQVKSYEKMMVIHQVACCQAKENGWRRDAVSCVKVRDCEPIFSQNSHMSHRNQDPKFCKHVPI